MEETTTSWKNHSFTMLVFGGIVVLCSIFFVLGMLVGRSQGQKIAEIAFAAKEAEKPVSATVTDEFSLNHSEMTTDNPDLTLRPAPEPAAPPVTAAPVTGGSSSSAPEPAKTKAPTIPTGNTATVKRTTVRNPTKAPAREATLQIVALKNKKQAEAERKKVESMGFTARLISVTEKGVLLHKVVVGPFKESEVNLKKADLRAKGYKNPIERW